MNIKKQVLDELENTKFPRCSSRRNVSDKPIDAFVLGSVNYRGQKSVGGKTKGPSRYNEKFPKLYRLIKALIKEHNSSFPYTTIQVNKNVVSKPHVDKNNVGPSYVIALGDFEGGNLVIKGKEYNIKIGDVSYLKTFNFCIYHKCRNQNCYIINVDDEDYCKFCKKSYGYR